MQLKNANVVNLLVNLASDYDEYGGFSEYIRLW